MTRTPGAPPPTPKCRACGIIAAGSELNAESLCLDGIACTGRMFRHPQNTPDGDTFAAVLLRLEALRAQNDVMLANLHDIVAKLRVEAYQKPDPDAPLRRTVASVIRLSEPGEAADAVAGRIVDALRRHPGLVPSDTRHPHDVLAEVARVLAPDAGDAGDDPYYDTQAKAAILAAQGGAAAERLMHVWQGMPPGRRQDAVWGEAEVLWRKVAAGQVIDYAQRRQARPADTQALVDRAIRTRRQGGAWPHGVECMEGRYDTRGDCDGELYRATLKVCLFDRQPGSDVVLCRSHYAQCVGDGEVIAGAAEVKP